jgi:membrane-associated phospholipid phosphatase
LHLQISRDGRPSLHSHWLALNLTQSARLFALLNISLADTAIGFVEAKYTYRFWRPVTAIRLASDDGDPRTKPDPNWLPLSTKTAPDPSYPGAHSAISFAGAEVLKAYLGIGSLLM